MVTEQVTEAMGRESSILKIKSRRSMERAVRVSTPLGRTARGPASLLAFLSGATLHLGLAQKISESFLRIPPKVRTPWGVAGSDQVARPNY